MNNLADKVALVTGGSRGIGFEIASALANEGARVVIAARDEAKLKAAAEKIKQAGGKAEIFAADMQSEDAIKGLVEFVKSKFGRLDILVNNAGVGYANLIEDISTAEWDMCMNVNARGPFILCRESLALLKKAQRGFIINMSSVVGVKGYERQCAYGASKHAIRGMSMALAEELAGTNVRVHVICPGAVNTEMVTGVRPDIRAKELIEPAEIAEMVLYLVTHKGNAVIDELHIRRATSEPWF